MAKIGGFAKRWSLTGLTALVTGGTSGIGRAVAEELVQLGATVYTCSKKESELNEPMQDWVDKGFQLRGSVCDVTCRDQRVELMKKVASAFDGKLNILINNVGTNIHKATLEYTAEDYAHIFATNYESSFHLCQIAHPLLKASRAGIIVFHSSISSLVHMFSTSIYGPTKAEMNQLTRYLACEWAKDGIRVNGVVPWFINTPLVEHAEPIFKDTNRYTELADPLLKGDFPKRSFNQAVAIAAMCLQEDPAVRPLINDVVTALSFLWAESSDNGFVSSISPDPLPEVSADNESDNEEIKTPAKERQRAVAETIEWGSNSRTQNERLP